jgi:hypothetical protein
MFFCIIIYLFKRLKWGHPSLKTNKEDNDRDHTKFKITMMKLYNTNNVAAFREKELSKVFHPSFRRVTYMGRQLQ